MRTRIVVYAWRICLDLCPPLSSCSIEIRLDKAPIRHQEPVLLFKINPIFLVLDQQP